MVDVVELKYQVVEVARQKYVCGCGGAVETAPGPARAVEGGSWGGIGAALGLPAETVRRLCEGDTPGFARVEVVAEPVTVGDLVVVTPSGFRIEGLDANSAATLIRQLA